MLPCKVPGFASWISSAIVSAALCASLLAAASATNGELGFSASVTPGLVGHFEGLFGRRSRENLSGWKQFVRSAAGAAAAAHVNPGDADLLRRVNDFFNRVSARTDLEHWGVEDYWASPSEFLASAAGDCEDYAIAKYFTLKELGLPASRLRLVYARTWRSGAAHMVLAYYATPAADPLIMDNLEGGIQLASDRPDLVPVYLFNDDDLKMVRQGGAGASRDARSIRRWRELLDKLAWELTL